jgi:ribose transport system substrate-binding protein
MDKKNISFALIPAVSLLLILVVWLAYGNIFRNDEPEKPRIVVILKTTERVVDFWQILEQGVRQAAEDFGAEVEITGPSKEGNIDEQIEIINRAAETRPDAIVLAAADYNKLVVPVAETMARGVPVLTVDSFINSEAAVSQIGTANYEAGGKLANYLKAQLPEGSLIGILSYVRESSTAIEREEGLRGGIDGYFQILPTRYNNDNIDQAASDTMELMFMDKPPDAIIALNEVSARGVVLAISRVKDANRTLFLTFDSNIAIIEGIKSGRIGGTVVQKPYNMGYQAVKTAVNLLNGQVPSKRIDTGSELVTRENLFSPMIQKLLFPTVPADE